MHNPVEEALTEASRPASIRQCTVLTGESPVPDPDYPVGAVEIETEEGILTVAVIAIIEVEGKVVVAVPTTAWHRKAKQRLLPPGSLEKAVAVQVEFINREGDEPFTSLGPKKIWLGYLSKRAEELVVFEPAAEVEEASVDTPFASESVWHLPEASALVAVADQRFAFVSAVSEGATGGVSFDHRLSALEQSVQTIAASVAKLVDTPSRSVAATAKPASRPSALKTPCLTQKPPGLDGADVSGSAELDQEVMRSARQAGIPEEQIAEMARLASRGRPKMADLPASSSKPHIRFVDPLEESEEDLADVEETNLLSGDPMQDAVTKLTQIAAQLTKQKTPSRSLESLLDGSGSAHSSEASSTSNQKYAVALRALRKALHQQPRSIYNTIEQNMNDDFQVRTQLPGTAPVACSARAWLELRSRVQPFQTPVRLLWGIAGVLDCLRCNAPEEARARCALLLACGDQLSIDRGSWIVASEMMLEEGPPMSSFQYHTLPSETEQPYTRLIDGRWLDLFLAKLSDHDALNEKKKKLSYKKPLADAANAKAPPVGNPKSKGDGGKGKGKRAEAAEADAHQT